MQSNDLLQYTSPLFKSFNLPSNGRFTPTALLNLLEPEQFELEITSEGSYKRLVLWSQSQKVEIIDGKRIKMFKEDGVTPILIDKSKIMKEGKWTLKTLCELMAQKEYFANKKSANKRQ